MTSTQTILGTIVSLWRYPVKSMMGEELNSAEVTKGGLLGDRAYALVDNSDGKVASAKNPRKWPQLFDFRNRLLGVLCLRSAVTGRFLAGDERLIQIAARHLAATMAMLARPDTTVPKA